MTEKICPVCNRPNISTAKRCWYCQSLLEDEQAEPGMTAEDLAGKDAEVTGSNEVPEWLARVRQRKAIEEMQQTRSLSPESLPPAEESGGQSGNQPDNQEEASREPEKAEASQLPEWLQGLGTPPPSEGVTKSLQMESAPEPENFSWLEKLKSWKARDEEDADTGSEQSEPPAPQPPAAQPPVEGSNEEWLAEFLTPAEESREETPSSDLETRVETPAMPAEIAEEKSLQPGSEKGPEDETYDFSGEEHPPLEEGHPVVTQFLDAEFSGSGSLPQPELPSVPTEEPSDILKEVAPTDNADLDWLTHYQEPEAEEPEEKALPSASQAGTTQPSAPFLGVQPSDWGESIPEPDIEPDFEAPEEEVEPAVLPAWMQGLRPIETKPQPSSVPSEETVREGPLAGIEGALVGANLGAAFEKPAMYTNKVQVTDRQSLRAELLQNLLSEPGEAKNAEETRRPVRGKWLKRVISLVMLVIVFAVLILAPGTSLLPVLFPPETANAYRLVNELSSDRPVLIAADFEAGLSGEMGFAAQSMLEHLMLRNIPLAVLSTNSVGSTLMDQMLANSQGLVSSYDASTRVVNFGYLAGASIGMQSLTSDLRTALPYDRNLVQAWTHPVVQNVYSLVDLGALVVVTDDADTGRYWIEQVQPALNGVPLILVTSAQAAPMLQPYYASGQVSAVVSGISGGSAYEQMMKLPGNSSYFFGAYQVLVLAVAALFLVGGLISLVKPAERGSKG